MVAAVLAPAITALEGIGLSTAAATFAVNAAAYIGVSRQGMLIRKPEAR